MKVGIVGSSKAPITESNILFVCDIMCRYPPNTVFISGGASGVDTLVKEACKLLGTQLVEYLPKTKNWEGYKARNLLIANNSDVVISIALPYNNNKCYHCNSITHDKTAGCWTAIKCKKHEIVVLNQNMGDRVV